MPRTADMLHAELQAKLRNAAAIDMLPAPGPWPIQTEDEVPDAAQGGRGARIILLPGFRVASILMQ
jgi:hypothetical protein